MSLEETEKENPTVEAGAAEEDDKVPEEEVTVVEGWAPSVTLEVKEHISTGEEEEETLFTQRSKLLRYEYSSDTFIHNSGGLQTKMNLTAQLGNGRNEVQEMLNS